MSLQGNEVFYVQGVTPSGLLSSVTEPTTTGAVAALAGTNPNAAIAVGASATAIIGRTYLLNTASGSVLTLPNAVGSGGKIVIVVSATVTSNAHKVLVGRTADDLQGTIFTEDSGTATGWYAATSSAYNSLQLNGTTTGGYQGDQFDLIDIAANVWQVNGFTKSTGSAATPFNTADS